MTENSDEIDWRVNCEGLTIAPLDSPDAVRNEVESIIDEINREQEVEVEIIESSDEMEWAQGGSSALVMDFVVQVAAGVSTALIVDMLRERSGTVRVEVADDE